MGAEGAEEQRGRIMHSAHFSLARLLLGFLGARKSSQLRQICVRSVARASRPWEVYKLSHGRDCHATKIRLSFVTDLAV